MSFARFSGPTVATGRPQRATRPVRIVGDGVVVRFAPIRGVTPRSALDSRLWLPALLDQWDLEETALHNEYDTLSAGQFSQPAMGGSSARQLRSTTLNTLTLDFDPPWLVAHGQEPYEVRERLNEVLRARKPVHLLMYLRPSFDHRPEVDMDVTLRRVVKSIHPGEVDTRYVTVDVSEWRDASVRRRGASSSRHSRKKGVTLPASHALKATDTLMSLSHEYYGTYEHWRAIRDANGISKRFGSKTLLVSLPGRWRPGYKVRIPSISKHGGKR